jgi:inner membrane protein
MGLIISSAYLALTVVVKLFVDTTAEQALAHQRIQYSRFMSNPAPLTVFLWRVVAESPDGYYIGYHSLFDSSPLTPYQFIPRNQSLLRPVAETRAARQLLWFSDGYYTVSRENDMIIFSDLRFGEFDTGEEGMNFGLGPAYDPVIPFSFAIVQDGTGDWTIDRQSRGMRASGRAFDQLMQRIAGI